MRALSAAEVLAVWEGGAPQHPLDRALTLLAAVHHDHRQADLARLVIGERDRRLWELRERTFGPQVEGLTECPACNQGVEVRFLVSDVVMSFSGASGLEHELAVGGWSLRFRLPDSRDLAAVAGATESRRMESELAGRCVLRAEHDGGEAVLAEVPGEVWDLLERRMSELDPQVEVQFELACPACGHGWVTLFDIADFLWSEVESLAHRLLREVAGLARFYGWKETDILRLSPLRRQAYLEMARS